MSPVCTWDNHWRRHRGEGGMRLGNVFQLRPPSLWRSRVSFSEHNKDTPVWPRLRRYILPSAPFHCRFQAKESIRLTTHPIKGHHLRLGTAKPMQTASLKQKKKEQFSPKPSHHPLLGTFFDLSRCRLGRWRVRDKASRLVPKIPTTVAWWPSACVVRFWIIVVVKHNHIFS